MLQFAAPIHRALLSPVIFISAGAPQPTGIHDGLELHESHMNRILYLPAIYGQPTCGRSARSDAGYVVLV